MKKVLIFLSITLVFSFALLIQRTIKYKYQENLLVAADITTNRLIGTLWSINSHRSHYYNERFGIGGGKLVSNIWEVERAIRAAIHQEIDYLSNQSEPYYADSVKHHLVDLQNDLIQKIERHLVDNQEILYLANGDLQVKKQQLKELPFPLLNFADATNKVLSEPQINRIILDLLNTEYALTEYVITMITIRDIRFSTLFPVVVPDKNQVAVGDTFTAKVSVGHYYTPVAAEDFLVMVDGQRLEINADGIANYTFVPTRTGEHELALSAVITNRLTGEKTTGSSVFTYQVFDCD